MNHQTEDPSQPNSPEDAAELPPNDSISPDTPNWRTQLRYIPLIFLAIAIIVIIAIVVEDPPKLEGAEELKDYVKDKLGYLGVLAFEEQTMLFLPVVQPQHGVCYIDRDQTRTEVGYDHERIWLPDEQHLVPAAIIFFTEEVEKIALGTALDKEQIPKVKRELKDGAQFELGNYRIVFRYVPPGYRSIHLADK